MYFISKRIEVSFAHKLNLPYESKCRQLHGHNGIVTIYCCAEELDENGMVVDFTHVKRLVAEKMDHQFLNEHFDFNPTAENLARWLAEHIKGCYKVTVQESEGNVAGYVKEGCEQWAF